VIGRHALRGAYPADHVGGADVAPSHLVGADRAVFGLPGIGQLTRAGGAQCRPAGGGRAGAAHRFVIVVCNTIADLLYAAVDKRVSVS